jgi:parallel beta-helix repeat protein
VNLFPGKTTFCLKAGVHRIRRAITPKSGNAFVGEPGAILDGTGWVTDDPNQGAFRAHNQNIDDVNIRNLVIRNMPQRGVHAFHWASDRWTIEHNEITGTKIAVSVPNNSMVRKNYIHHNASGYAAYRTANTVFDGNEIAYNGLQKVVAASNLTFRNNVVRHNTVDGIWFDGGTTGGIIEGNTVEDNAREGIFIEISSGTIIRNNTLRRNGYSAVMISTSKRVEIHNNLLENNFRGIQYFLNCEAVGGGGIGYDLADNSAHHNVVKVGTKSGSLANGVSYVSSCTSTRVAPYLSGSKRLTFNHNSYAVPSSTTNYFFWGLGVTKGWIEWRAQGHDSAGVYP